MTDRRAVNGDSSVSACLLLLSFSRSILKISAFHVTYPKCRLFCYVFFSSQLNFLVSFDRFYFVSLFFRFSVFVLSLSRNHFILHTVLKFFGIHSSLTSWVSSFSPFIFFINFFI